MILMWDVQFPLSSHWRLLWWNIVSSPVVLTCPELTSSVQIPCLFVVLKIISLVQVLFVVMTCQTGNISFKKSASLPVCQKKYPFCGRTFTNFLFSSFFLISYALEFVDLIYSYAFFKYLHICHLFSVVLLAPFPSQIESIPSAMSPKYFKQLKCLPPSPPPAPPRAPFHALGAPPDSSLPLIQRNDSRFPTLENSLLMTLLKKFCSDLCFMIEPRLLNGSQYL